MPNTFVHVSLAKTSHVTSQGVGKYTPTLGRRPDIHTTAVLCDLFYLQSCVDVTGT